MHIPVILLVVSTLFSPMAGAVEKTLSEGVERNIELGTHMWLPNKHKSFTTRSADPWATLPALIWIPPRVLVGKVGTSLTLWNYIRPQPNALLPNTYQFDIDFLVYNHMRKRKQGGFSLDTTDTKFGFHLDILSDRWSSRLGVKHISAHLVDGILSSSALKSGIYRQKQSYSREFFEALLSYDLIFLKPYVGLQYILPFHIRPNRLRGKSYLVLQSGGEILFPHMGSIHPFAAFDLQIREEFKYDLNQSYIVGLQFKGEFKEPLRIGFHYYRGYDLRGEFFDETTKYMGMGIQHAF